MKSSRRIATNESEELLGECVRDCYLRCELHKLFRSYVQFGSQFRRLLLNVGVDVIDGILLIEQSVNDPFRQLRPLRALRGELSWIIAGDPL